MTQKEVFPRLQEHKEWINNRQGKKADLRGADLRKINLEGADLRFADFRAADLSGSNLTQANCQNCDFRGANLTDAVCIGTNFTNARLDGANLNGVDLRTATLEFAQLTGANMTSSYRQTPAGGHSENHSSLHNMLNRPAAPKAERSKEPERNH